MNFVVFDDSTFFVLIVLPSLSPDPFIDAIFVELKLNVIKTNEKFSAAFLGCYFE